MRLLNEEGGAPREPYFQGQRHGDIPEHPRAPVHLVLDNLRSAFNVGSIFRTADAGAAAHIHLCGMSAHPPHPKLDKTALGASHYVPWTYHERTRDCLDALTAEGITPVAIELTDDAVPMQDYAWPRPVAIVLGNEVTGIRPRVLRHCAAAVCIPMHGHKNSINVATAAGIVLYHILGRWGHG